MDSTSSGRGHLQVFIYGTLKKNEPNGSELSSRNAVFLGDGLTVDKWPLIVGTSANIPFILNQKGFGKVSLSIFLTSSWVKRQRFDLYFSKSAERFTK